MKDEWNSENNHTPVFLPNGRATTKDQLRKDGVYTWDSPEVLNQKQGYGNPSVSGHVPMPSARTTLRALGTLAIAFGLAVVSMYAVESFPVELSGLPGSYRVISYEGKFTPKERTSLRTKNAKTLKTEYGALFNANAPLEKFWESCQFKGCTSPDIGTFQHLQTFAKSPATYWSDFCEIGFNLRNQEKLQYGQGAGKPKFDVTTAHAGSAVVSTCVINNKVELKSAYLMNRMFNFLAAFGAFILAGCMLKVLWSTTKNAGR